MAQKEKKIFAAFAALTMLCCCVGCGNGNTEGEIDVASQLTAVTSSVTTTMTSLITTTTTTTTTETTTSTTETTTLTEPTTTTAATTTTLEIGPDGLPIYKLSDEDMAFLSDTVFVGDSICSGLSAYEVLPADRVVATGSVGARSIFDYTFEVKGGEYGLTYALTLLHPKYIIFSMGMNDVRMGTQDFFCENYDNILNTVHNALPDAKLFVCSVTPVLEGIDFTTNAHINTYSYALECHYENNAYGYRYLDISTILKNDWGSMIPQYNGGDGIHLAKQAYYAILYSVCRQLVDTGVVKGVSADGVPYGYH